MGCATRSRFDTSRPGLRWHEFLVLRVAALSDSAMPDAASSSSSSSSAEDSTAYVYDRHGGPPVHRTVEHEALHAIFSSFDRNRSGSIDSEFMKGWPRFV